MKEGVDITLSYINFASDLFLVTATVLLFDLPFFLD